MRCAGQIRKNYLVIGSFLAMVLLATIGATTMPLRPPATAYQASVFSIETKWIEDIKVEEVVETTTSTTSTTVAEIVTTTSTIKVIPKVTTTTAVYVVTNSDGPPRNTTTLVGCIAYYESTWGKDPNVFQFTQGTWENYGGVGSPSRASYATQEKIFWLAWEDDGYHHWAAQKGRCF